MSRDLAVKCVSQTERMSAGMSLTKRCLPCNPDGLQHPRDQVRSFPAGDGGPGLRASPIRQPQVKAKIKITKRTKRGMAPHNEERLTDGIIEAHRLPRFHS